MSYFNIRVYGLLLNEQKEVLVSDELIRGGRYTKFPGGGMEFGEGTRDCLMREFMEELNLKIEVGKHIYTTDFFQLSAFRPGEQIISIYYLVHALEPISVRISPNPFDFDEEQMAIYRQRQEVEAFRLVKWKDFSGRIMSLPIDKVVADIVKESF